MPPARSDLERLTHDPSHFLDHEDPLMRRMAVTALTQEGAIAHMAAVVVLAADPVDSVRAAAAERLGWCGAEAEPVLDGLRNDPVAAVREAVATAYGELGAAGSIDWLVDTVAGDDDRQVKEAAVAALGAIGDPRSIEPLLGFIGEGPPQVRRRAIAAITVFDDPRIEPAVRRAALDRNPGVREAAEMVVGRQINPAG